MKPAWEWKEADILDLIANQVQESLTLDYKACAALVRTEEKTKRELSKDVSAFANSAGGEIVYGVVENKHIPTQIDVGYNPFDIGKEWIEQVTNSNIQSRIDGIRINQIQLTTRAPGKVIYVVSIPQSVRAPHMASDHRFYKRYNFESIPMEEYEVRDVGRRLESPDLHLDVTVRIGSDRSLLLLPHVSNHSAEPAFHATLRLFLPEAWLIVSYSGWNPTEHTVLGWNGVRASFRTFHLQWISPPSPPMLEAGCYEAGVLVTNVSSEHGDAYQLGYELRAPKMITKLGCLLLIVGDGPPCIEERPYVLERI